MKKKLLALILLVCSFGSSQLIGKSDFEQNKILKHHGTLYFTFVPARSMGDALPQGKWRASIVTPDNKVFKGPKINAAKHHLHKKFTIKVKHPILFGVYKIVIENINVTNFVGSLTTPFVRVKNSFNDQRVDAVVPPLYSMQFMQTTPNNPGTILVGDFVPFHPFIPH